MALAADIIGDRWTLLILREAFYGVQRYDDMREDLAAPRSMLSNRLTRLVEQGLMCRQPYRESGDRERHAYVLTNSGRALALTMMALTQWGEAWLIGARAPVEVIDSRTGEALHVAVVHEDGTPADITNARLQKRLP